MIPMWTIRRALKLILSVGLSALVIIELTAAVAGIAATSPAKRTVRSPMSTALHVLLPTATLHARLPPPRPTTRTLPPRATAPLDANELFAGIGGRAVRQKALIREKGPRWKRKREVWSGERTPDSMTLSLCGERTAHSIVVLLTITEIYTDFFDNWMLHYARLNLSNTVVVVAEDTAAHAKIRSSAASLSTSVNLQLVRGSGGAGGFFASKGFNEVMSMRAAYLLRLLRAGRRVILADVDSVWLKNPIPHVHARPPSDTPAMAPFVAQLDSPAHYCAGFLALCPTVEVLELVEIWERTLLVGRARSDQVWQLLAIVYCLL